MPELALPPGFDPEPTEVEAIADLVDQAEEDVPFAQAEQVAVVFVEALVEEFPL